ncbi:MAG: HAD family hydrolase [bacterium]|nr:HAD family hydrolase [bacterium]
MYPKAIFFDLYQTLIDVDFKNESEGRKAGFEKVIIPYLLQNGILESKASLVELYYSNELHDFYKNHDIELFQHSFPAILSEVFSRNYNLSVSEAEMSDLLYEFRKVSRGYLRLYEGARDALEALSKHYTLVVASHTQGVYTERELGELDILRYFKYRIYSSDIGFKKKSNNFYQKCLEVVGLNPKDCAMVGDNLYEDMYMANQNGIHTLWIINPLTRDRNKAEVVPEASLPIESIRDLPSVIAKVLG